MLTITSLNFSNNTVVYKVQHGSMHLAGLNYMQMAAHGRGLAILLSQRQIYMDETTEIFFNLIINLQVQQSL